MEISASLFEQITGAKAPAPEADDRRRAVRTPLLSRATVYPDETGIGVSTVVRMRDVSVLGVGFEHLERLSIGDKFVLHLPRISDEPLMVVCVVQRCQPLLPGRTYLVGATYLRLFEADAIPLYASSCTLAHIAA